MLVVRNVRSPGSLLAIQKGFKFPPVNKAHVIEVQLVRIRDRRRIAVGIVRVKLICVVICYKREIRERGCGQRSEGTPTTLSSLHAIDHSEYFGCDGISSEIIGNA